MSWLFGKKEEKKFEEKVGELPELPELPPLKSELEQVSYLSKGEIKNELPALPPLTPISVEGKIIEETAKLPIMNISDIPEETGEEPEGLIKKPMTREIGEDYVVRKPIIEEKIKIRKNFQEIKSITKNEPLFVRIDKYQDSLSSLEDAKKKVFEIENVLKSIKETRTREEAELQGWESEVQEAKELLDKVDKTLFSKLD